MGRAYLIIPGPPVPKKRTRNFARWKYERVKVNGKTVKTGNKIPIAVTWDSQRDEAGLIREAIRRQWTGRSPLDCPIVLTTLYYFPIPKGANKTKREKMIRGEIKHTIKPDEDNLRKWIKDLCNKIVWTDDKLVYRSIGEKGYSENPRTEIIIEWD